KLISSARTSRSGSRSSGSKRPERCCAGPNDTELEADENPPSSITERNEASLIIRFQKRASSSRAASRPPSARPQAKSAALIAPALEPLMVSKSQPGSSSRRSRTPQLKAEKVPPPCSASDSLRGGHSRGGGDRAGVAAIVSDSGRSEAAEILISVAVDLGSAAA